MPLTLRTKDQILDTIISSILAGNIVTDINNISVTRQICEGMASTQADLSYDLYTLLQGWYRRSAEGMDLDIRGLDYNVARDPGQAASDPVTFTKAVTWIEDIPLPSPQVVLATLADGTEVLYRSLGNHVLQPSGRSVSGQAPATTLTSGVNDTLVVNVDGDGNRTMVLGTQASATAIAAAIQAAVRALAAMNPVHQEAYNTFRCDYGVTTAGAYTLRSGLAGPTSSVVVTAAGSDDASAVLKLGITQGGVERGGMGSLEVPVICDTIGVLGNVGAGQLNQLQTSVPGIERVANALAFSNGKDIASDDAYRQDIETEIHSIGVGGREALENAAYNTVSADGQRHVMSCQVLHGSGSSAVYVCDGRSLAVGAQAGLVADVQDELDGRGQRVGGWAPSGNVVGVAPATVLTINLDVVVSVGATPDLALAQSAITNALYQALYTAGVGQLISVMRLDSTIDATVAEVFHIVWHGPLAFTLTPPAPMGGGIGVKPMPGTIAVRMVRA